MKIVLAFFGIGTFLFLLSVVRLYSSGGNVADFGFFINNIRNISNEPFLPITGHFQPISYIFYPLNYFPRSWLPLLLLAVQCFCVTFTSFILYRKFSRFYSFFFLLNPFTWSLLYFDFHYECIATVLFALLVYFLKTRALYFSFACAIGLCAVKEIYIAFSGVILLAMSFSDVFQNDERRLLRKHGVFFLIVFILITFFVLPSLLNLDTNSGIWKSYKAASSFNVTQLGSFALLKTSIIFGASLLILRLYNWQSLALLFCLATPYFLSTNQNHHLYTAHYWSVFVPLMIGFKSIFQTIQITSNVYSLKRTNWALVAALYLVMSVGPFSRIAIKNPNGNYGLSSYLDSSKDNALRDWAKNKKLGVLSVQNNSLFPSIMIADLVLPFPLGVFEDWVAENGARWRARYIVIDNSASEFIVDQSCITEERMCNEVVEKFDALVSEGSIVSVLKSSSGIEIFEILESH